MSSVACACLTALTIASAVTKKAVLSTAGGGRRSKPGDVEHDVDRDSIGEPLDRRREAALGQLGGHDPVHECAQLVDCGLDPLAQLGR